MTKDEATTSPKDAALKLALDLAIMHHSDDGYAELRSKVRQLAKEALAQDEQSSSQGLVYLVEDDFGLFRVTNKEDYTYWNGTGRHKTFVANTTPPKEQQSCDKRPWVGLTEDEILDVFKEKNAMKFARNIEVALRSKNT